MDNTGTLLRDSSDDYLNGSPGQPGGLLKSKPTWPETFGFSATSAFFVLSARQGQSAATICGCLRLVLI